MIDVKQTLQDSEEKMEMAALYLEEELNRIRAGRANVAILDCVRVESYGSKVPLNQVASVSVPDARTIAIKPWDKKQIRDIEKAIMDANIGMTPQNNGEQIRCNVPPLTEDRRKDLIKKAKTAGENAKVVVRNARRDAVDTLKKAQKNEGLPEDAQKEGEEEVQKVTDKNIKEIDALIAAKEKDIMTV